MVHCAIYVSEWGLFCTQSQQPTELLLIDDGGARIGCPVAVVAYYIDCISNRNVSKQGLNVQGADEAFWVSVSEDC